ncbi:MAG: Asp-tRNA(Asn)/Glu-tRNA(Gln) amidotransferase subunit GatB [Nitrospirae bacterium]|nr:Asp-tRNA(Asn)/Glu-tRNA(Gln) amidotransferase subunit GatB [Nitrospirota bacterium]MCL5285517.1 Asp-tRNA(Asn)/Glu-tRNA(Gln) amidotransferase subunit GatB [Nitrospirota bacterium]
MSGASGPLFRGWEVVVGLEVHTQLLTKTKLFCRCENRFGAPPNTLVCPVCLGHPGTLPVLNGEAVRLGVRAGLAAGCRVSPVSTFERKHYFYPDLPKGYQISQYAQPLLTGGGLRIRTETGERTIRIHRMHLEEDAGKNLHAGLPDRSHVDLNRAGVPLLEIVSEPDIRSPDEAVDYLKRLRQLLRATKVSDGNMEEGSFRCDVNLSIRRAGAKDFGTRVEIKNVNSFRFVHKAMVYEIERQIEAVESGEKILQETRLFDPVSGRTKSMRSKEEALDYRYFPEPDLPLLVLEPSLVEEERGALPELPEQRMERFCEEIGLARADAEILVAEEAIALYFEEGLQRFRTTIPEKEGLRKARERWTSFVVSEVLREFNRRGEEVLSGPTAVTQTVDLIERVLAGSLSFSQAKEVYSRAVEERKTPVLLVEELGLSQVSGEGELLALVEAVLSENPSEVAAYRGGKDRLFGFFVGAVMKKSRGKANPEKVNDLLRDKLKG